MILNETIDLFKKKYEHQFKTITIKRVNIGVYFAVVQLSSGFCGLSCVDAFKINCSMPRREKEYNFFSPGKISGQLLLELFDNNDESMILDIVKLAAINAVSAELISNSEYPIVQDKDPFEMVSLESNQTVCLVGAFHSYLKKIAASEAKLMVLELNESAVPDEYKKYYVSSEMASSAFLNADTIIITGSTLMNNTIDNLLSIIPPNKQVIVVGPTAGLIPDILFLHNVDIVGSTRVLDADMVFKIIAEGGSAYHLFYHQAAQKICLLKNAT